MNVGDQVQVDEDVNGYYVKACGIQISISIPKMTRGRVTRHKPREVEMEMKGNGMVVWLPRDKVSVIGGKR